MAALQGAADGMDGDVELPGSETKRWLLTEERIVRDIVRCATCKGDLAVSAMTSNQEPILKATFRPLRGTGGVLCRDFGEFLKTLT